MFGIKFVLVETLLYINVCFLFVTLKYLNRNRDVETLLYINICFLFVTLKYNENQIHRYRETENETESKYI